jgi:hypothetical protein
MRKIGSERCVEFTFGCNARDARLGTHAVKRRHTLSLPAQVTQNVGVSFSSSREYANLTFTVEVDNFTNAKVFDFFGAQRPGRAFYLKMTGDLR